MKKRAFTLIELLVVIIVIAVLASLLIPALNYAKQQTQGIQCLSNIQQLTLAWASYTTDNNSKFPLNIAENEVYSPSQDWVLGIESVKINRIDNTNILLLTQALLGPYIFKQIKIFKCPGDTLLCNEEGAQYNRVRSVSMNCFVGTEGEQNGLGSIYGQGGYYVFEKESNIINPAPSQLWIMLDEDAYSINDAFFLYYEFIPQFADLPARYHNGSTSFSFADGHVETHSWMDNFSTNDINWMQAHTTAHP